MLTEYHVLVYLDVKFNGAGDIILYHGIFCTKPVLSTNRKVSNYRQEN